MSAVIGGYRSEGEDAATGEGRRGGGGEGKRGVGGVGGGESLHRPVAELIFDWTLVTFCIVVVSYLTPISDGCDYPAFLYTSDIDLESWPRPLGSTASSSNWTEPTWNRKQTTTAPDWLSFGGKLKWRGRIRAQNTAYEIVLTVQSRSVLRVVAAAVASDRPEGEKALFNWTCLSVFGSRKYFVSHEANDSNRQRYACLEFIERSSGVLQIRSSSLVDEASPVEVCNDDKMELDSWILLLDEGPTSGVGGGGGTPVVGGQQCLLTGGFSVRIYDKTRHQGLCDGYRGETRIETDCLHGDGMYFYFRHQSCIPETLYMYSTQRTLCLASWLDGPYTFTLLRHDRHHYMWLLRFPTLTEDSFTAYLFKDLSTDSTEYVSRSQNFLRLDVVRDSPRPATSLCVDDYDVCSVWREPCTSGPQMALTCPRTCGICNASRPVVCSFAPELVGKWHDGIIGSSGNSVTFSRTSVVVVSGSEREEMRCIRWQSVAASGRLFTRFLTDEMLVTEYVNGCRPRYACARILKKSSAVMFFKLSKTLTWPLTSSPADPIDCTNFDFEHVTQDGGDGGQDGGFRERYFRLLFSAEKRDPVQCRLPSELTNYSVTLRDGTECIGSLTEAYPGNEFQVTLTGCLENATNFSYACLESSRLLPSGDLLIVTGIASSSSSSSSPRTSSNFSIHCWVFPKSPQFLFYQIDGAQCNEASRGRLRQEVIVPVAVFSRFRRKSSNNEVMDDGRGGGGVTVPSQLDSPEISPILNNNQVLLDEDHRSAAGSDPKAKVTPSSETRSTNNHDVNSNPFILLCVVLTFALFQCVYFCHQA